MTGATRFDRFRRDGLALTQTETQGMLHFVAFGCEGCHIAPFFADNDVLTLQGFADPFNDIRQPLDQNPLDANDFMAILNGVALYDTGTHNTGVRPGGNHELGTPDFLAVSEDIGRGGMTGMGAGLTEVPLGIGFLSLLAIGEPLSQAPSLAPLVGALPAHLVPWVPPEPDSLQ